MTMPPARHRILLTTDAVGGVWTYTMDIARRLAAQGVILDIAVLGPLPDAFQFGQAASIEGASLIVMNEPLEWCMPSPEALAACGRKLAALAAARDVSSVHLHSPSLLGSVEWPAPVTVMIHSCVATWWRAVKGDGNLPDALAWQAAATRRGLRNAAAVIAPSHAFAAAVREAYDLQRPIIVVPNGLPPAAPVSAPRRHGVLAAGRLWDEGKNIAAVDRAVARLSVPVIAAGPLEGPNGACIALHHAKAIGRVDSSQLQELMTQALVFASPAFYEPFGLAILEAAQSGMALVLGDIHTLRELWEDAALFVDPADDSALAAAIAKLHASPDLAASMGRAAQARAARYGIEKTVSALWDIHARLARMPALETA